MINPEQIRAARGLLDWSTAELAKQSGLTINGINKIERGHVRAHTDTLELLQKTFEENSIEFIENSGVRIKQQGVEVLMGQKGLCQFFDGVYEYVFKHGGLVQQTGVNEVTFSQHLGDYSAVHIRRMTEAVKKHGNIKFQALIQEGDMNFVCSEYAEYRWLPKELFEPAPFYVYGDNLAVMSFQTIPSPTIILSKIMAITLSYRKQFEALWNLSKIPPSQK